jgi:hypothetical protein
MKPSSVCWKISDLVAFSAYKRKARRGEAGGLSLLLLS